MLLGLCGLIGRSAMKHKCCVNLVDAATEFSGSITMGELRRTEQEAHTTNILAMAELSVAQITSIGLRVEPDEPPPRHASMTHWPVGKDEWMSKAQELAAVATLRLRGTHSAG